MRLRTHALTNSLAGAKPQHTIFPRPGLPVRFVVSPCQRARKPNAKRKLAFGFVEAPPIFAATQRSHLRNFGCKGKHKKKWLPVAIPVANFIFGQKKFVLLYLDVQSGIADQLLQLLHITLTSRLRHVNMAFRKNLLHIAFARARSKCHQTA